MDDEWLWKGRAADLLHDARAHYSDEDDYDDYYDYDYDGTGDYDSSSSSSVNVASSVATTSASGSMSAAAAADAPSGAEGTVSTSSAVAVAVPDQEMAAVAMWRRSQQDLAPKDAPVEDKNKSDTDSENVRNLSDSNALATTVDAFDGLSLKKSSSNVKARSRSRNTDVSNVQDSTAITDDAVNGSDKDAVLVETAKAYGFSVVQDRGLSQRERRRREREARRAAKEQAKLDAESKLNADVAKTGEKTKQEGTAGRRTHHQRRSESTSTLSASSRRAMLKQSMDEVQRLAQPSEEADLLAFSARDIKLSEEELKRQCAVLMKEEIAALKEAFGEDNVRVGELVALSRKEDQLTLDGLESLLSQRKGKKGAAKEKGTGVGKGKEGASATSSTGAGGPAVTNVKFVRVIMPRIEEALNCEMTLTLGPTYPLKQTAHISVGIDEDACFPRGTIAAIVQEDTFEVKANTEARLKALVEKQAAEEGDVDGKDEAKTDEAESLRHRMAREELRLRSHRNALYARYGVTIHNTGDDGLQTLQLSNDANGDDAENDKERGLVGQWQVVSAKECQNWLVRTAVNHGLLVDKYPAVAMCRVVKRYLRCALRLTRSAVRDRQSMLLFGASTENVDLSDYLRTIDPKPALDSTSDSATADDDDDTDSSIATTTTATTTTTTTTTTKTTTTTTTTSASPAPRKRPRLHENVPLWRPPTAGTMQANKEGNFRGFSDVMWRRVGEKMPAVGGCTATAVGDVAVLCGSTLSAFVDPADLGTGSLEKKKLSERYLALFDLRDHCMVPRSNYRISGDFKTWRNRMNHTAVRFDDDVFVFGGENVASTTASYYRTMETRKTSPFIMRVRGAVRDPDAAEWTVELGKVDVVSAPPVSSGSSGGTTQRGFRGGAGLRSQQSGSNNGTVSAYDQHMEKLERLERQRMRLAKLHRARAKLMQGALRSSTADVADDDGDDDGDGKGKNEAEANASDKDDDVDLHNTKELSTSTLFYYEASQNASTLLGFASDSGTRAKLLANARANATGGDGLATDESVVDEEALWDSITAVRDRDDKDERWELISTNEWNTLQSNGLIYSTSFRVGDAIYLCGGLTVQRNAALPKGCIVVFKPLTNRMYVMKIKNMPPVIYGHTATVLNNRRVLLFGGIVENANGGRMPSSTLFVLDLFAGAMFEVDSSHANTAGGAAVYSPPPRFFHQAALLKATNVLAVVGGRTSGVLAQHVDMLDLNTFQWFRSQTMAKCSGTFVFCGVEKFAMLTVGSSLVLFGGYTEPFVNAAPKNIVGKRTLTVYANCGVVMMQIGPKTLAMQKCSVGDDLWGQTASLLSDAWQQGDGVADAASAAVAEVDGSSAQVLPMEKTLTKQDVAFLRKHIGYVTSALSDKEPPTLSDATKDGASFLTVAMRLAGHWFVVHDFVLRARLPELAQFVFDDGNSSGSKVDGAGAKVVVHDAKEWVAGDRLPSTKIRVVTIPVQVMAWTRARPLLWKSSTNVVKVYYVMKEYLSNAYTGKLSTSCKNDEFWWRQLCALATSFGTGNDGDGKAVSSRIAVPDVNVTENKQLPFYQSFSQDMAEFVIGQGQTDYVLVVDESMEETRTEDDDDDGKGKHDVVEFDIHKAVLMRFSYFRSLLTSTFLESRVTQLTISGASTEIVAAFVHFCYTDELAISADQAVDMLLFADRYDVDALRMQCQALIEVFYDFESLNNVLSLLLLAWTCHAKHLQNVCEHTLVNVMSRANAICAARAIGYADDEMQRLRLLYTQALKKQ